MTECHQLFFCSLLVFVVVIVVCSFCLGVSFSSPVYHKALCTAGKELLSLTKVQVCRAVSGRAVFESYRQETNISNWGT